MAVVIVVFYATGTNKIRNDKNVLTLDHAGVKSRAPDLGRIKKYANAIRTYAAKNQFNDRYCFLIDMSIASGFKRFFVYDLKIDSIVNAGMVAHGNGTSYLNDIPVFSNEPGSNCSSIGKYKIGRSYYGTFGLAYKLHGLDRTNSHAFDRFIVLHAHPCVPSSEIAPHHICRSWGCPTVAPLFLDQLRKYLDKPGKPILLWVF